MKAVVYRQNGGPEVLSYEDVPDPVAGPDEVLIKVEAISIEGGDLLYRSMLPLPGNPHTVGYATAGEVEFTGANVKDLKIGDKVTAFGTAGSHAERRVVHPGNCWVLPSGFDMKAAACVPIAFGTAHEALFELGHLKAGETVLVQGAAGGVSLAALQLAKRAGARVIGTGSSHAQLNALRRYGLDEGIDYQTENIVERVKNLTGGHGADLAVDPVGGAKLQQVISCVGKRGRIILLGGSSREPSTIDATSLVWGDKMIAGFMLGAMFRTVRVHTYVADLIRQVAAGELEMVVDRVFALSDAQAAHRYAEQRGRIGRVVMIP